MGLGYKALALLKAHTGALLFDNKTQQKLRVGCLGYQDIVLTPLELCTLQVSRIGWSDFSHFWHSCMWRISK